MSAIDPDWREQAIAVARDAYEADLIVLNLAGCGPDFAEWLSALPDPDTDGVEHDG